MNPVADQIEVGSLWACVTAQGRGQPVKILAVSALSVKFRPVGRTPAEPSINLPRDLFLIRYCPLSDVEERQKTLARLEQAGETPVLEDHKLAPTLLPARPTTLRSGRPAKPRRSGRLPRKLTEESVRQIYARLQAGEADSLLAHEFSVDRSLIRKIHDGTRWGRVTAQFRANPAVLQEERMAPPSQLPTPDAPSTLMTDMADALELLLAHAGRPLPKYLSIDRPAIEALIAQARALALPTPS